MRRATIVIGLWIAAVPARAGANAPDYQAILQARHHLQLGRAALDAGKNVDAVLLLQQANRLAPLPEVYCAMAIALEQLGREGDAALRRRACEALSRTPPMAPTPGPSPVETRSNAVVVAAPHPVGTTSRPFYKRWWVWTAAVAVSAVTLGLALGLTPRPTPTAPTSLGTWNPF